MAAWVPLPIHRPKAKFPLAIFNEQKVWVRPYITAREEAREGASLLTCRETNLMECMDMITDKPNWDRKVFDDEVVAKWRTEIVTPVASHSANNEHDTDEKHDDGGAPGDLSTAAAQDQGFSPRMFDWAIAELRYKARIFPEVNCIEALDGVWKSDTIVSRPLQENLQAAIAKLEDLPAKDLDWHPGSDGQVLDIVHPSIYPFVYGVSRVLTDMSLKCGVNDCLSWVGQGSTPSWDAEVRCSIETGAIEIRSYINNLHPLQKDTAALYPLLEQLIECAIPLWNRTLSPFKTNTILPPRMSDWSNSLDGHGYSLDISEAPEQESDEEDDDFETRYEDWKDSRSIAHPEPDPKGFREPSQRIREAYAEAFEKTDRIEKYWDLEPLVDLRRDDFGKGPRGRLQVVVKVANIHLTPEKPRFKGGSWHVEGTANESICATALYYHSTDNVTSSRLCFRQQTEDDRYLPYEQSDFTAIEDIYGFTNEEATIQELGSVLTCAGRLLTFPNVMQHRVEPFELEDKTRPGYRKLIALFLVDPHVRILSTSKVPPQQKTWWQDVVRRMASGKEGAGGLGLLPVELREKVLDATDGFPISLEETKHQREELMRERTAFAEWQDSEFKDKGQFNLCEH